MCQQKARESLTHGTVGLTHFLASQALTWLAQQHGYHLCCCVQLSHVCLHYATTTLSVKLWRVTHVRVEHERAAVAWCGGGWAHLLVAAPALAAVRIRAAPPPAPWRPLLSPHGRWPAWRRTTETRAEEIQWPRSAGGWTRQWRWLLCREEEMDGERG